MEVNIFSQETIRPSSPTPNHLRTYKLSVLDQIAPFRYVPIIFFYSENPIKKFHQLKPSLSETLTHFYPLAGRIKDKFSIDCNDEGVSYIEACVSGDMSPVIQEPEILNLQKLLPCNPYEIKSQLILAVQVNCFDCGGIAIGINILHRISDASALASFVTTWAKIARGDGCLDTDDGVIFDCTKLFPPQDISSNTFMSEELLSKGSMKKFKFDGPKIAALREELGKGSLSDRPTRVEAVAALIWSAVMGATGEKCEAGIAIDLRKRMDPQLRNKSIGNLTHFTLAKSNNENNINCLAGAIHESIRMVNNEYIKKIYADGGYFKSVKEHGKNPEMMKVYGFSSWCKYPLYEADFGWGKPSWVSNGLKLYKFAIFIDTKDGEGIEAWVGLPNKEDMSKFQENPAISAFATFSSH